jgi:class 3 adenylate cyclase/predicted ATPase
MNIGVWLRGLGLEQYAPAFLDNAIDAEVLRDLTADDLKDLGVNLVGHRRKLLAAIAALKSEVPPAPKGGAVEQAPASSPTPLRTQTDAERRQLTVMFCDLVGSTALSGRLDPEDLREILGTYHAAVSEEVARLDGFVAKFMGDGVLAYFGYPQAHEDDAERAIRTALAIIERIGALKPASGMLALRVGIATGLVVVGDLIGSGEAQERGVVGETPNLAARLQAMAEPNGVLIAGATQQLVGDLFEYRDLGSVEIRGFNDPVLVWQVLRPSAVESRFEALHATALTPLVGREEEIDLLLRRWQLAKSGEGQVVLISGEPGIGKSRIIAALREELGAEPHTALRYFCSPHHRDSALYPFIAQIERAAGFGREDTTETKLDKLETLFSQPGERGSERLAIFVDLLSVPTGDRYPPSPSDPQRQRETTLAGLLDQLQMLSQQRPVLMIFEDTHWADATSLELLDRAVERARQLPVMIVITFRPEFAAPWVGQAHVTSMGLSRLAQRDTTTLIGGITGGKALPAEILDQIVERTDGIPLFVEELTKTLLESGLLREEDSGYTLTGPLPPLAIPSSLQASLLARLDRLMPVKDVAQIGAALGREFSYELLAAVARHSDAELREALNLLTEAGLILRRGNPPHATFMFKHALVQDAAYSTLLRSQRQEIHARIAGVIEDRFPELSAGKPEILAHHTSEAGFAHKAANYWLQAGQIAASRSANAEASGHLMRGIEMLAGVAETPERDRQELTLQLALGPALMSNRGYHVPGARIAYQRARQLAERLGDDHARFAAVWGMWLSGAGEVRDKLVDDMFEAAERLNDDGLLLQAHHSAWATWIWRGELIRCHDHVRKGLALYDEQRHRKHALLYGGHDPAVCGKGQGGILLWLLGYPDQAARSADEGITLASALGHMPSLAHSLWFAGCIHLLRRDVPSVLDCGERLLRLGGEHRLGFYRSIGGILHGWSLVQVGNTAEGLAEMRPAVDAYGASGPTMVRFFHATLAQAELSAGNHDRAAAVLSNPRLSGLTETFFEPGILCIRAEILLAQSTGNWEDAHQCYCDAITVAREQRAKSLELRAAINLARLWSDQGKCAEVRNLLAPVYGWFSEGFGTSDLREAKAILDKLSQ